DSDRAIRLVEPGHDEDRLPPRSRLPLRPGDAGDRRSPFQLFAAARAVGRLAGRDRETRRAARAVPLGADDGPRAQLSPTVVARDLSVRRVSGALQIVPARRPRASRGARRRDVACTVRDVAQDERYWLSQLDAGPALDLAELAGRVS